MTMKMSHGAARNFTARSFSSSSSNSPVVANIESTARDHLANERTFLAYLRTSCSFMAAALGVHELWNKLDNHDADAPMPIEGKVTACMLLATGQGLLVFSAVRYFKIARLLQLGKFEVNGRGVLALSAVVGSSSLAIAGAILYNKRILHSD